MVSGLFTCDFFGGVYGVANLGYFCVTSGKSSSATRKLQIIKHRS